jgi:uncharacterized repeat protein (TIGR01451 family)
MAVMLATIMVGSAFMVAVSSLASSPTTPGLEGWTLHEPPATAPDWTSGVLKGYSEGDVVPVRIILYDSGSREATVTVGFEWGYGLLPTPELRGYDHVVMYNEDNDATVDPEPPYNVPHDPVSGGPFCTDTTKATITEQTHVGPVQDGWRVWDEWTIKVSFLGGNTPIDIRAGGQLFITTAAQKGASWFPGASLHVRLMEKGGANDLPINVLSGVLTPPNMQLHKFVRPDKGAAGDILQFEVELINMGQADANLVSLVDFIPLYLLDGVVEYQTGPSVWWDSRGNTIDPFPDPTITPTDVQLTWDLTGMVARGTGLQGSDGQTVNHLLFEVKIKDVPAGRYMNVVKLTYTDHNEDPRCVWAEEPFYVVKPAIEIEKTRVGTDLPRCAAGLYDSGGLPREGLGDLITYKIIVYNPGSVPMRFEVEDAWLAPVYGTPIWWGTIDPGETLWEFFNYHVIGTEERAQWDNMFRNTANVKAWDLQGHMMIDSSSYDIDILHPDARLTKTADREIAKDGETVTYTFKVENLGDTPLDFYLADPMFSVDVPYDPSDEFSFAGGSLGAWLGPDGEPMTHDPPAWTTTRNHVVDEEEDGNPVQNTAYIVAVDPQEHKLKRASTEEVDVVHPGFTVNKRAVDPDDDRYGAVPPPDGKDWVGPDMMVLYEITVTNTGDTTLYFFYTDSNSPLTPDVSAALPEDFDPPYADADQLWNGKLEVRQSDTKYWWYHAQESDIIKAGDEPGDLHVGQVKNTVTVTAWWNNDDEEHRLNTLPPQSSTCYVEVAVTIAGIVFNDVGAGSHAYNGIMEGDEVGLADFWVELHYAKETSPGSGVWIEDTSRPGGSLYKFMASKTSSDIGDYFFDAILPGNYIVKVLTVPPYPAGTPVPPEDYFPTMYTRYVLHPVGGDAIIDKDFGLAEYSEILGFKWLDRNMNGEWDDNDAVETGLNGWTITLSGTDYEGNPVSVSQTTATIDDPRSTTDPPPQLVGAFYFTKVKPGQYSISETVRDGWYATTDTRHPTNPLQWFHVADGQLYDQCHNFGNVPMRDIEGYKFYDKNMDGLWDEDDGEPALQYFTMKLYKAIDPYEEVLDPATDYVLVGSTVTNANGWYYFEDVKPGKYMIKEGFPTSGSNKFPYGTAADWYITNPEDQAFDDLWDTMWDPPVNPLLLPDLGNMRYARITGFHFHDYWGIWGDPSDPASPAPSVPPAAPKAAPNHHKDAGEPGLGGFGVNLYKWDNDDGWVLVLNPSPSLEWTTYSAAPTGKFTLKVVPGDYRIVGELGIGWWWTTSYAYEFSVPAIYNSPDALEFRGDFGHALKTGLDPELKFFLEPGWNLWSVPMIIPGGLTASSLLQAIGPTGVAVSILDKASGEYKMFISGDEPVLYDFPIELGDGCYVWVSEETQFGLEGELVYSAQTDLVSGWNIVGFSELGSMMASEMLTKVVGCTAIAVSSLDPITGQYSMYIVDDGPAYDFLVGAGQAYFLWVDGPGQLVIG